MIYRLIRTALVLAAAFGVLVLSSPLTNAQGAPEKPWKKMKKAERKEYMKKNVLPKMTSMFAEVNPTKYDDMKCITCHGAGAKNGSFKMPNPKLPKLPGDEEGWTKLKAKSPEMLEFMRKKVVPTMAAFLGEQPRGPGNPKGFGCDDCHTHAK